MVIIVASMCCLESLSQIASEVIWVDLNSKFSWWGMPPDPPSSHAYARYYHPATILFPPIPNSKPCSVFLVGTFFYQKITIMCMGMAWQWEYSCHSFEKFLNFYMTFLPSCNIQKYNIPEQQCCDPGGHWWRWWWFPVLHHFPDCLLPTSLYWVCHRELVLSQWN